MYATTIQIAQWSLHPQHMRGSLETFVTRGFSNFTRSHDENEEMTHFARS